MSLAMTSMSAAPLLEPHGSGPARRRRAAVSLDLAAAPADYLRWQTEIVAILQQDFSEVLSSVTSDDIDWPAWKALFIAGKTPRAAVERALERDL